MVSDLEEKVALVTGGASGIGRAIVQAFLEHGVRVASVDLDKAGERVIAGSCCSTKGLFIRADLTQPDQAIQAVERAVEHFGRLDIVVNNAAILGHKEVIDHLCVDEVKRVIATNLEGPIWVSAQAATCMKQQGRGGVIINISSISAIRGSPLYPIYSATKAGLIGLTRSLAQQLGPHRIRINAVCPGSIGGTGLLTRSLGRDLTFQEVLGILQKIPLRRLGQPADIAGVVLFLASDQASFINGAILVVDGGEIAGCF